LVILFPVAVGSLFVYSKYLKKMALVGNLIISSFAAGVAGIIGFAEMEGLMELGELAPRHLCQNSHFILGLYAFCFLFDSLQRNCQRH
jgi:4-hydroxybenzoate polyprenyltransferase